MNGSHTKAEIEEIKRLFNPPIPKEVIEKIIRLANSFFEWLGADMHIDKIDIRFASSLKKEDSKISPSGMVVETKDKKLIIYFNRYNLNLNKPDDVEKHKGIFKHEFYHLYVWIKFGKDVDKEGYSEALAYLISIYEILKEREKPYYLIKDLEDRISNDIIRQIRQQQQDYILDPTKFAKIRKKAMKMAEDLIDEQGEYLLVNPTYKEPIISLLSRFIEFSLPNSHRHLARCMAEKAIDLLYEKYEEHRNLKDALRHTLVSYLEYRRRVIEGCGKG